MSSRPRLAVAIGRFQVSSLHEGHKKLLGEAQRWGGNLLVLIGDSGSFSFRSPLDYEVRKAMIRSEFPESWFAKISDKPCDKWWSRSVDDEILRHHSLHWEVKIFHSRDSFADSYSGRYELMEVDQIEGLAGTGSRNIDAEIPFHSKEFRAGMIYAAYARGEF